MSGPWVVAVVAQWVAILLLGLLLAGCLRELGLIRLRLGSDPGALVTQSGLERGTDAPAFALDPPIGDARVSTELPPQARVLVFMSPGCTSCDQLVPHLNEVAAARRNEFDWLVICRGDRSAAEQFRRDTSLALPIVADREGDIERAYDVAVTPFVYLLDYSGRVVMRGVANNWRQLEGLLDQEGNLEPSTT